MGGYLSCSRGNMPAIASHEVLDMSHALEHPDICLEAVEVFLGREGSIPLRGCGLEAMLFGQAGQQIGMSQGEGGADAEVLFLTRQCEKHRSTETAPGDIRGQGLEGAEIDCRGRADKAAIKDQNTAA